MRSILTTLFLSIFALLQACTMHTACPFPTPAPTGFVFRETAARPDAPALPYVVYVPRTYDHFKPIPAIVFLHGSGESGTDGQKQIAQGIGTNILWNADRWPCIVIMPQKPSSDKLWDQHTESVMAALAETRERYAIDPSRIALTGLSQGGHGVWTIACKYPDTWCALAPICGFIDSNRANESADEIAKRIKHIPVGAFHGGADDVVKPEQTQRMIDALKNAGASPRFSLYPGVNHGSWDKAYAEPELPAFLMIPRGRSSDAK